MKKNWFAIYDVKGQERKVLEPYSGSVNFELKPIDCENCGGKMIRKPIGVPYLKFSAGYLLLHIRNGLMIVNKNTEVPYVYTCMQCSIAKSHYD